METWMWYVGLAEKYLQTSVKWDFDLAQQTQTKDSTD